MRLLASIALLLTITIADIERAQRIARSSDSERARFHSQYVFRTNDATVTQIEVITEFRRLVIVTEEQLRAGNWMFSQGVRAVEEAVKPFKGLVSLFAQIRFHPLNVLTSIPPYKLGIGTGPGASLMPVDTITTPEYSLQTDPTTPQSLYGARLEARLVAADIGQTKRPVGVLLEGKELVRIDVDFSRID